MRGTSRAKHDPATQGEIDLLANIIVWIVLWLTLVTAGLIGCFFLWLAG